MTIAAAQQSGFGAMVSFEVRGGVPAVETLHVDRSDTSRSPNRSAASRVSSRIRRR